MEELEIRRREIIRYLGYKKAEDVDDRTKNLIEECISEIMAVIEPRYIYDTFPIEWKENSLSFAGINVTSEDLTKNLKGCDSVVMLAVTIGHGFDKLIRRAEVSDMSKAYILQATGTEVVEAWCNKINSLISADFLNKGLYTRPRFSPGYGDLPLEMQRDFENVLHMRKNIGISLSDGTVMTPTKSVTAIIGLTSTPPEREGVGQSDDNSDEGETAISAKCKDCRISDKCSYSDKCYM